MYKRPNRWECSMPDCRSGACSNTVQGAPQAAAADATRQLSGGLQNWRNEAALRALWGLIFPFTSVVTAISRSALVCDRALLPRRRVCQLPGCHGVETLELATEGLHGVGGQR
jgi:hypothetical protein